MNKIFFFCLMVSLCIVSMAVGNGYRVPRYNGGPRNVYYLTGMKDNLFISNEGGVWSNQDGWSDPYSALRDAYVEQGYQFFTSLPDRRDSTFLEQVFVVFCHNVQKWHAQEKNLAKKTIVLVTEPPHVLPRNYDRSALKHVTIVLTWDDRMVDNKKFFKYFFVQSQLNMINDIVPFADKKLCTFIGGNKNFRHKNELYSHRKAAITFFEKYAPQDFDFYGRGWNSKNYKTYRGTVISKTETLKKYKFSICYENICKEYGYITEKLFGSCIAGCVPIYWGADNVTDYIPSNCFIDKRNYPTMHDLYQYISTMKETEYNQYIENIRAFLSSKAAENYSIDSFVSNLMSLSMHLQASL